MIDDSAQNAVAGMLRTLLALDQEHSGKREDVMTSGVRVLKRGRSDGSKSLPVDASGKKGDRQSSREIVSTVKSWIAELDLRRLSRRTEALRLLK
jgi:hypothetical protein